MTPQEQQMIDGLISRIRNTQVQNKDADAEQHIRKGLASYPDALYVLTQTVLVQQYGLDQAQAQINELKQQVQTLQEQAAQQQKGSSSGGGSFLSHIFGGGGSSGGSQQGAPAPQPSQYQPVNNPGYGSQGGYAPPPPPPYPSQGYPVPSGGVFGGSAGMGGGGFLQGALQTAAGVAAGEMVFQGMEDLFHGFGGHGGYERGFGGGGGGETIVNNYYDDDRSGGDSGRDLGDRGRDDSGFYNPSDDASRSNFSDTAQGASDIGSFGGNADFSDTGNKDDLSFDNSDDASNDSSSFDDSSSDDFSSSDDNS